MPRERLDDRFTCRFAAEAVEAQIRLEQAGNAALEALEAGERVLPDRDQEGDG